MTAPGTEGQAKPILRTTDATADAVRALAALMSSQLGGRRVTHDQLIAALAKLGNQRKADLIEILQAP